MEYTNLSAIRLTPDSRHLIATVIPRALNRSYALTLPNKVAKALAINLEQVQYSLEAKPNGVLVFTPEPRPCKWAISEGGNE